MLGRDGVKRQPDLTESTVFSLARVFELKREADRHISIGTRNAAAYSTTHGQRVHPDPTDFGPRVHLIQHVGVHGHSNGAFGYFDLKSPGRATPPQPNARSSSCCVFIVCK